MEQRTPRWSLVQSKLKLVRRSDQQQKHERVRVLSATHRSAHAWTQQFGNLDVIKGDLAWPVLFYD